MANLLEESLPLQANRPPILTLHFLPKKVEPLKSKARERPLLSTGTGRLTHGETQKVEEPCTGRISSSQECGELRLRTHTAIRSILLNSFHAQTLLVWFLTWQSFRTGASSKEFSEPGLNKVSCCAKGQALSLSNQAITSRGNGFPKAQSSETTMLRGLTGVCGSGLIKQSPTGTVILIF